MCFQSSVCLVEANPYFAARNYSLIFWYRYVLITFRFCFRVAYEFIVQNENGEKIPPMWTPTNPISKAAAIEIFFPRKVEAIGYVPEVLPPQQVCLDASGLAKSKLWKRNWFNDAGELRTTAMRRSNPESVSGVPRMKLRGTRESWKILENFTGIQEIKLFLWKFWKNLKFRWNCGNFWIKFYIQFMKISNKMNFNF